MMVSRKRDLKNRLQSAGRPREFDESEVLDKVMTLFWQQGYEGTSLQNILSASGLTKGSVYKAFGSKHNLYIKSLERYEALHVDRAVAALIGEGAPLMRLDDFLSVPILGTKAAGGVDGCFLCNASADRACMDAEARALVQRGYEKMSRALEAVISQIRMDWPPEKVNQSAQMMLSVYSGLQIMSRAGQSREQLQSAKNAAMAAMGRGGIGFI